MSIQERAGLIITPEIFDTLMPLHMRIDAEGMIVHLAPTLAKLCPNEDVVGRSLFEVMELRTSRGIKKFEDLCNSQNCRLKMRFRQGHEFELKAVLVQLPDHGAIINTSLGIAMRDIVRTHELTAADFAPTDSTVDMLYLIEANSTAWDESRRLTRRLQGAKIAAEEQAFSDTLTGLRNRRAMDHLIGRMIENEAKFSVMNLDLDFFKQVNDTLGHAAGDHVLQQVAKILSEETRSGDVVARVGGDEFVLAFNRCTSENVLDRIASRIITRLEQPIPFQNEVCNISASAGTTLSTYYDKPDLDQMLADADKALYASKRNGRACHSLFSPNETAH
ncbi:MAG: GGDEF domain-containing protein [Pseudomonadota bacterium]